MPIKKIEIHGLNPEHPLATVIDEINANLDNILEHVNGIDAETGVVGPTGAKGDKGDSGQQGIEGPAGKDGKDGQDGKQGEQGPAGKDGKDGINGTNGRDGLPGAVGEQGPAGIQGLRGEQGIQGIQGPAGKDGAQGPAGVGIKGFASGYVDAGQFVTLDNLKFTVTTSGNRGLSCATVTGTVTLSIAANYSCTGGGNGHSTAWPGATYNTTPSGSWFGYHFPNAGDGSTYLINDYTNQRMYRVHLLIGYAYTKNFISIERLM